MTDQLFHRKKSRKNIQRKESARAPYETVLIVCEGEKTEVNYFNDLCKTHSLSSITVLHSSKGSDPLSVVNFAIEQAEKKDDLDHVFCVFDKDIHTTYQKAIQKIKNYKPSETAKSRPSYHAIYSVPCFEIWVLLHFKYTTTAYIGTQQKSAADLVIKDIRNNAPKGFQKYEKSMHDLYARLEKYLPTAHKNAKTLKKENTNTQATNPATEVNRLVERLDKLQKTKPYPQQ